ncbi:hypothetical protein [Pseudoxanthomonas koreensis]|uniref:hypothetical protein n=1 Tax=Pseudoxanthomonas koreensis TaxID=266061 RepID=UPI0013917210|nr:hypothetical protein [Pseudoxanthomonas koreensis]KAF1689144.1 hypothetical protein CSC64_13095 [Pseudoxanthomonas koreensis]
MTPTDPVLPGHDAATLFVHVRILIGMIVGLGLTHLLRNFADLMERPGRRRVYWVHLAWSLFVFLYVLHFWWWEFRLGHVAAWNFNVYLFISLYALLLYLLCAFSFSSSAGEYPDYREYFYARRHWFFGLLALVYAVDFVDTWIKGAGYFHGFGREYVVRNLVHIALCLVAIAVRSPAFHGVFVVAALAYQVSWIVRQFELA